LKAIALLGSPRAKGNTELLLEEAIKGAGGDVEVFRLSEMDIRPCDNCGACEDTGECVIGGDDMPTIYRAIKEASRIILATPIYFMGPSAQAKAMIDRCQAFWCEKYLLKRPIPQGMAGRKGLLLLVGGMKRQDGVKCSNVTATAFFRSISVQEHGVLSYTGVDAKGAILKHPSALREAFDAGAALMK